MLEYEFMKGAIHQFLTGFTSGDAISDYAIEIQKILRAQGYVSEIFCEYLDPKYYNRGYRYSKYFNFKSKQDLIIFHYSMGSYIVPFVYNEGEKIILIYHNITPHQYFKDLNLNVYKECLLGRKWLPLFANKIQLAIADSEFNKNELEELGFKNVKVLPIKIDFTKFDKNISYGLLKRFRDNKINWIYIGRIAPHKRVEDVILTFYFYQKYFCNNSRLFLVGLYRGFERYYYSLLEIINNLKIKEVIFTSHASLKILSSLLRISDIFIILSEHEGFCVPLLEAMHCGVVVVASDAGAIPFTLKDSGVIVKEKNLFRTAALINEILNNERLKNKIIKQQKELLKQYKEYNFEKEFLKTIGID